MSSSRTVFPRRNLSKLKKQKIIVSLFIDPDLRQVQASREVGADFIELHTGVYARSQGKERVKELYRLRSAAQFANLLGLGVNAGHGLNYENVKPVAKLPYMEELNIGHAIIAKSVFVGLRKAVQQMAKLIR